MRIRIDDQRVYASEDQDPRITVSVNDIRDPSKIRGARSTSVKIISTNESRRALGSEGMDRIDVFSRKAMRIGNDSVDLFRADVVKTQQDRDVIELQTLGGNATWFDYANRTKLREFNFGVSDVVDAAYQRGTWTDADTTVLFPLIDFGSFEAQPNTHDVAVEKLRPAVMTRRILEQVFEAYGYQIRAKGRFAAKWPKIYTIEPKAEPSVLAPNPYPTNIDADTSTPNPDSYYFIPASSGVGDVELIDFHIAFDPFDTDYDGVQFRIVVYDFTAQRVLAQYLVPRRFIGDADYGDMVIAHTFVDVAMAEGNRIGMGVQAFDIEGYDPTMSVVLVSVRVNYALGAQTLSLTIPGTVGYDLTEGSSEAPYKEGARLNIAALCPQMSAMELLKALINDQCLVVDTDPEAKTIDLWYDEEYFRKPGDARFRDWRGRVDHTRGPMKVIPDRPQRLVFSFKEDEDDRGIRRVNYAVGPPGFANYTHEVENGLDSDIEISIPFAPTYMGKTFGGIVLPTIRTFGETVGEDNYKRERRILLFDGVASGTWKHDGDTLTEYPVSYFGNGDTEPALAFDNGQGGEIVNQGTALVNWDRRIREYTLSRTLECYVMIRDTELWNFDHGSPTLVDDGKGARWYYVAEIQQHRFGKHEPTKVILTEIPIDDIAEPVNPALSYPSVTFCAGGLRVYGAGSPVVDGVYCPDVTPYGGGASYTLVGGTYSEDSIWLNGDLGYYMMSSGGTYDDDPNNVLYVSFDLVTWSVFDAFGGGGSLPVPSLILL